MASMKELFPLHPPKRVQRNFIKENIRNARGCAQCIADRRAVEATSPTRSDSWKPSTPSKCYIRETTKMPSAIKYNVKIVKRDRSSSRSKHSDTDKNRAKMSSRGCQTEKHLGDKILTTCENCGHPLLHLNDNSSPVTPQVEDNTMENGTSNEHLETYQSILNSVKERTHSGNYKYLRTLNEYKYLFGIEM